MANTADNSFEKYVIGVSAVLLVTVGGWMGSSIIALKEEVVAMRSDLKRFDPASVEVKTALKEQSDRLDKIEQRIFEIEVGLKSKK